MNETDRPLSSGIFASRRLMRVASSHPKDISCYFIPSIEHNTSPPLSPNNNVFPFLPHPPSVHGVTTCYFVLHEPKVVTPFDSFSIFKTFFSPPFLLVYWEEVWRSQRSFLKSFQRLFPPTALTKYRTILFSYSVCATKSVCGNWGESGRLRFLSLFGISIGKHSEWVKVDEGLWGMAHAMVRAKHEKERKS